MRVASEMKDAFVEVSSDVETECTAKSQIMYDDNSGAVAIGDGTQANFMVASQFRTIETFRSACYPIGSFIHSLLDQTKFREFMGDTGVAAIDNKWRNATTFLTDVTDVTYVLVEETTDLGQYLILTSAVQVTVLGVDYRRMANPKGRFLRGADPSQTKDGVALTSNTPQLQQNFSHTHSYNAARSRDTYFIGDDETPLSYTVHDGVATHTGGNGGDESRPDTVVCNLYIKVNE